MPDWRRIVRERIAPLRLEAAAEADLTEELAQHLEDRYRELRAGGAGEKEAYEQAAAELQDLDPIRAQIRPTPRHEPAPPGGGSRGSLTADIFRDLRYALRATRRNPLFALFVVLTLALGIGANTTVFTVINTLILNPLPVPNPAGLVAVATGEANRTSKSRAALPLSLANLQSLVTAALFLRSIERTYKLDPGFDTAHLAVFMTNPGQAGYGKIQTEAFYREARERVAALPGVESASWASNLPLWGRLASGLEVEGREQRSKADILTTVVDTVDTGYFQTAGIAIDRGRDFTGMDRESALPVAIVNEELARDYWPGEDALGRHIRMPGEKFTRQVIGVARTANYSVLGEPPQLCVYLPLAQSYFDAMTLYVRSKGDPGQILVAAQRELRAVAPRISVDDVRTGRKIVDQALFGARMGVVLLSVFGLLALGLAGIGLYGILAYSVSLRKREIGVRMALGAAQSGVLSLILKEGMSLVLAGVILGLAASQAVGSLLARMLYGVSASDPMSIAAAVLVLLAVAFAVCYLPARRASRVDPLAALREG